MELQELHQEFLNSEGVSTDTRENLKGKLYFALKGDNFDGNAYALQAIKKGAVLAVVDDVNLKQHKSVVVVADVLTCLQNLATYHREYLNLPILAITGSNGKTTTKELVSAVLTQKFNVTYTQGNLNNHIGVPLTLLSMTQNTEFGVVEMGANHQGEIARLCKIARPDYGYITNFGKAHLEGFGGFEGVIKGKSELYDFLRAEGGIVFVNADDPLEVKQSEGTVSYTFGKGSNVDCQVYLKATAPFVVMRYNDLEVESQLFGNYNGNNIAAAVCIGKFFDVDSVKIKEAIQAYKPTNNRSQIIKKGTNTFLLDAYNANPTSMELAITNFEQFPENYKVVILGDMFEVGETSAAEHQKITELLSKSTINESFVCGDAFGKTAAEGVNAFSRFEDLQKAIKAVRLKECAILIKGSRGMQMERLLGLF